MKFLSFLGKRLKDDDVIDVLECAQIKVVYDFDRLHENIPDRYWAASKKDGFLFGFDANQILEVIFLYVAPNEDFAPVIRTDCDVQFFSTIDEVEAHGAERKFRVTKGKAALLGIQRDWVRLEYEKQSVHYEFRSDQLALVTITKR
jgi:hypothetical protein